MAINLSTLVTNADAIADQIEAESDTDAHYTTMVEAIKTESGGATLKELFNLQGVLQNVLLAIGVSPPYQKTTTAVKLGPND